MGKVKAGIQRLRKRGFYSETALVKKLMEHGYNAVRVPVSNPSMNPLPDVIARRGLHVYAFEVKNAKDYAYFPERQVRKLFEFLNQFVPLQNQYRHVVLAAHFGKRWVFHEKDWADWEENRLPEKERIFKRDKGNFDLRGRQRKLNDKHL